MASKMLVNRNTHVVYCVTCANKTEAMEDEAADLQHVTDVGDAVCSVCGFSISALPEPPIYCYDVQIQAVFPMNACSPIEVEALIDTALSSLSEKGIQVTWVYSHIAEGSSV